jgi:hypothetical protein
MGRNNEDFRFERKLTNAIGRGVRTTNGVKTTVRVGPDFDKQGSPFVLRGRSIHGVVDATEQTAPLPTRKRDVNKAVNKLHKKVSE